MPPDRLCVGQVVGSQGLRGVIRVRSFTTKPADLAAYGPVENEAGNRNIRLKIVGEDKGVVLVQVEGVADRDAALALKGERFYVQRSKLPATSEDEFYHADLVGLRVETVDGHDMGKVLGVFDFGAGDVIEFGGAGKPMMLPFTQTIVPIVDIAGGRVVVAPPGEIVVRPDETDGGADLEGAELKDGLDEEGEGTDAA